MNLDIQRDAEAQGDVENRCKETLEVMQTSAGHGADPSTTKRDLYAALLNPENLTKNMLSCQTSEVSRNACFTLLSFQLL